MEERSLRIYQEKTFFSKITNTITKLLIPTRIGINGMLISIKRNNVLKTYEAYANKNNIEDEAKKDEVTKKFEDTYALYLESIDKYVMDSIYKKVKNDTATDFEKNALSQYYAIVHLKESEYLEYKYKKQMYLLRLDYENVEEMKNKPQLVAKYKKLYASQMEGLYKGILKHYSIKLADNLLPSAKEEVYHKIFTALEEYIEEILPIKMEQEPENKVYQQILEEYQNFEKFTVGKLDQNDTIEKNMILLGLSRKLFTHSLPLVVAEQCYDKLLQDTRSLIIDTKVAKKQEKAYSLLMLLIEEYNVKLLATKIYWDKPLLRDEYKKFWTEYQTIQKIKESNYTEYIAKKQVLFLRDELTKVRKEKNKYYKIIGFYQKKLVELGAMQNLKNSYISEGTYYKRIQRKVKQVANQ
ncbi:MAG: hypothetical protein IJ777_03530 [Clostridia bacterium]|nr:hypothetical protein [Clostridia bacterium]